jgi:curved DNA-binding protein CbpA
VLDFEELDHYALLGISRAASADDIKRAYRREIAKYHPDRYANAGPDEREYAALRAQRINEAYRVLSDGTARGKYQQAGRARFQHQAPPPAQHRDYQAELYDQARAHLDAGRPLQAVASLRQLQKLNPLYRDSADLLASAQAQLQPRSYRTDQQSDTRRALPRKALVAGGIGGAMAATALLVWAFGRAPNSPTSSTAASAWTSVPAPVATEQPSELLATPLPNTSVPTDVPPATIVPSPTPRPTVRPSPTAEATLPAASPIVLGQLLLSERFDDRRWAEQDGRGWSVGYRDGRYRITADPGVGTIWSYRTGPAGDVSYQVELQASGEGGLLLRFQDERNYLICTFDSGLGSYRISQQIDGVDTVLAEGRDPAIKRGTAATNLLETRLLGDQLQLFANGKPLTQITLKSVPDSPRYGFVAIAGDSTIEALFDNFEIRALEP